MRPAMAFGLERQGGLRSRPRPRPVMRWLVVSAQVESLPCLQVSSIRLYHAREHPTVTVVTNACSEIVDMCESKCAGPGKRRKPAHLDTPAAVAYDEGKNEAHP